MNRRATVPPVGSPLIPGPNDPGPGLIQSSTELPPPAEPPASAGGLTLRRSMGSAPIVT